MKSNNFTINTTLSTILLSTTLIISPIPLFDLYSLPKFLALSVGATVAILILIFNWKIVLVKENKVLLYLLLLFIWIQIIVIFISKAPLDQQLFGVFFRNTGLLTYIFLSACLLFSKVLTTNQTLNWTIWLLRTSLIFESIYTIFQYRNIEFKFIKDTYGNIIPVGTFGNQNFISAFLGIGFAVLIACCVGNFKNKKLLSVDFIVLILIAIALSLTGSKQGIIISIFGSAISVLIHLHRKYDSKKILFSYFGLILFGGLIFILGAFNNGPLRKYIYEASVSYRGDFWHSGIEIFKNNFFFGVGLDSFGDWYRQYRTADSIARQGVGQFSTAAHNVFIDFASQGGIFLFFSYLSLVLFILWSSINRIFKNRNIDIKYIAIFIGFISYLAQSIISINSIGVVIWGWIFGGLLLAQPEDRILPDKKIRLVTPISVGLVLGFTIGFLPLKTDVSLIKAVNRGSVEGIVDASKSWPTTTEYVYNAIIIFNKSKFYEQELRIARFGVERNPRDFLSWRSIYRNPVSSELDKKKALKNLQTLDPNNKEF